MRKGYKKHPSANRQMGGTRTAKHYRSANYLANCQSLLLHKYEVFVSARVVFFLVGFE